jgi:CBS domain-containing protein
MSTRTPVRVEEYMSTPVETVPGDASLVEAARRMREQNIKALVVETEPLSIVTSTDVVDAVAAGENTAELAVTDATTDVILTVAPDQFRHEAASKMLAEDISHLPVTEGDDLVGMLTKTDVTESRSG